MNDQLEAVEISIKQAQEAIAKRNELIKLMQNPSYQKIIVDGYFENQAIALVMRKSNPDMQDEANQKSIITQIDAIGSLFSYLNGVMQFGNTAERTLLADEETRSEILAEQL